MKLNFSLSRSIVGLFLLVSFFFAGQLPYNKVFAAQSTCPNDNGWVKVDSNDMSSYPVAGATQYCFKAGSDYLRSALTDEELSVGARTLLSDPDARRILIHAYKVFVQEHNFTKRTDDVIADEIRRQINLIRSAVIHGAYGYLDD